jgi:hypothetical protein
VGVLRVLNMIILKQMLQLMIQTMMNSLKVFLKNLTNKTYKHKKKERFSRRRFGFREKEDSDYGRESEEKVPV